MPGDLQTPFDDPIVPTPSGKRDGGGTSGGFDMGDGTPYETANSESGLPTLQTTVGVAGGPSAPGTQVPMPPVASPGTFATDAPGE